MVQLYPQMTIYVLSNDFDAQRLRADTAEAERDALRESMENQVARTNDYSSKLTGAEQRNAELRELLRLMTNEYACCLEAGHDRITFLGGDCDSVSKMLSDNDHYAKACAALNPNPERHYSDCATNNRGVPELLGPCDCGYEGDPK